MVIYVHTSTLPVVTAAPSGGEYPAGMKPGGGRRIMREEERIVDKKMAPMQPRADATPVLPLPTR